MIIFLIQSKNNHNFDNIGYTIKIIHNVNNNNVLIYYL